MRNIAIIAALSFVALGFAMPHSFANTCGAEVIAIEGPETVYIVNDVEWIYLESNQSPGLQRGGHGVVEDFGQGLVTQTDDCQGANPDTIIY